MSKFDENQMTIDEVVDAIEGKKLGLHPTPYEENVKSSETIEISRPHIVDIDPEDPIPKENKAENYWNAEHYNDPVGGAVLTKEYDSEKTRFYTVLKIFFDILRISGFELDGRIVLRSKKTGRIFR